ncbi:hypothetical protein [Arthrobacter sp. PsM3]|uniref:hypothetical protein n=1 Tax=Arthrobacter sp. PsM3 TaxID=3030531 RepID=UPI00263B7A9C|nr:hypothetical protein [Arthrobacter sp. PsM3]MDN4643109.1 hypothetical protein [Arthrobacter sp. PsM3]
MEKTTSPSRTGALPASRTGPILSIVAALAGPLCVIFLTGYLTIQLQLSEVGAPLLDFSARPILAGGEWVPYLVRAAFVLLAVAVVLGYRVAARTGAARVVTLTVLIAAVFAGANTLRPVPMDGEPQPIALFSLINGATSPFTLALIGAVIADLISIRRRNRLGPDESAI